MGRPIEKQHLRDLCARGVQAALEAGADEAEVFASSHTESEATLEKNDLGQARRVEETTFGIRVYRGGAAGFCTSNQGDSIDQAAAEAVALARLAPSDPMNGLPEGLAVPETEDAVDPALLGLAPEDLTRIAMDMLATARGLDPRLTVDSGAVSVEHATKAIVSSKGMNAAFESAQAQGVIFGMCVDGDQVGSFSYEQEAVRRAVDLAPALEGSAARFVEKCAGALGARPGESFRGPVILPPETVLEFLLGNLMRVLGADSVRVGQSPLADKRGQAIAVPEFSLVEEGPGLPGFALSPFDREGILRQRVALVEEGVLQDFLYDTYEGRAAGKPSTGHAAGGAAGMPRIGAGSLSLAAGTASAAELNDVERGVYVTRFSGSTNAITGDFSGVIKGGFLVRRGERIPIDETTMAGNLYDCLKQISAVSSERRIMQGRIAVPAVRIEDISITAG